MTLKIRRVVAGLDPAGRSSVVLDTEIDTVADGKTKMIWTSDSIPARNDTPPGNGDFAFDFGVTKRGGTAFVALELPPGKGPDQFWMHATDTLDYCIVLRGRIEFAFETGKVTLETGQVLIDRGVLHGARALGEESAVMAVVMIPALPVGNGATV